MFFQWHRNLPGPSTYLSPLSTRGRVTKPFLCLKSMKVILAHSTVNYKITMVACKVLYDLKYSPTSSQNGSPVPPCAHATPVSSGRRFQGLCTGYLCCHRYTKHPPSPQGLCSNVAFMWLSLTLFPIPLGFMPAPQSIGRPPT